MLHSFTGLRGQQRSSLMRGTADTTVTSTSVTAGGTIGTYGASWTQVIASTPFDATWIRIGNVGNVGNSAARGDLVVTVAKGGSGSEQQIIGPLLFGGRPPYSSYLLPCFVPSGTRLSLKSAAGVASRAITFWVDLYGGPNRHETSIPTGWIAYGTTVSSGTGAYGTLHTAGSTNAWSSWANLGNTTRGHDVWMPMAGVATGTTITALNWRTQLALGTTTEAATMVTNGTGYMEGPHFTGNTTEQFGAYNTATNPVLQGVEHIRYAPRLSGASMSIRAMCSGTPDANVLSMAVLAAVK